MPGPQALAINLSEEAVTGLTKLIKAHQTGQQLVLRARIIVSAGQGHSNAQIARALDVHMDTVRLWRQRWQVLEAIPLSDLSIEQRLADLPRPGAPAQITADQRCQIEALACEKPEKSGRPITHWTQREIADELIQRKIVENISPRHAGRLLKRERSQTPSDPLLANARLG
ncbi:MAG TPA: helix-turn-helix domain-containing protein [Candidatus Saccharimonadales bacterium]|nr:helix-turn-helix domain-containing protein [Candidatus Saccharimonadales bacterium]